MDQDSQTCDLLLAGTGLANALVALRLASERPDLRVIALDRDTQLGAGRTWSFFSTDLSPAQTVWVAPLVAHAWDGYEVRFPGFRRVLTTGYCTLSAERIDRAVAAAIGSRLRRGADIMEVGPGNVALRDGTAWRAPAVLDGRGGRPSGALWLGWQKFVGQELRLAAPHGLERPIVMDATVPQIDGYRFIYVLPLAPDRLLVEDTRYSDTPALDREGMRAAVAEYADRQGWRPIGVEAEEQGALPLILDGDIEAFWAETPPLAAPVGVRAALFHPVTSYSLPSAVALADDLVDVLPADTAALRQWIEARSKRVWRQQGFYRLLNRMLFLAGEPELRWKVFARFYTLPQPLIERFYAGRCTLPDRMRVLVGRPPVPFFNALGVVYPSIARPLHGRMNVGGRA